MVVVRRFLFYLSFADCLASYKYSSDHMHYEEQAEADGKQWQRRHDERRQQAQMQADATLDSLDPNLDPNIASTTTSTYNRDNDNEGDKVPIERLVERLTVQRTRAPAPEAAEPAPGKEPVPVEGGKRSFFKGLWGRGKTKN